ncbi:sensor histidine kinase [Actinorugispora endophytica]|uniref:histidine kinase n=1 Tax=Actinorugispora endophytica TaxID=1605990 RepID=A0A4R6UIH7_9ACTN|nr:histidine kinase [Actinorugispora endophytica]TDQ45866.1 signal transduction histidine kinase [Actinorugispora endophytica]
MGRRWTERADEAWRWGREHRHRLADVFCAVGSYPFVVLGALTGVSGGVGLAGLGMGLIDDSAVIGLFLVVQVGLNMPGLVALSVLVRRRRPVWLMAAALAMLLLFGNPAPAAFALYSHAVWSPDRRRLVSWSGAYSGVLVVTYTGDYLAAVVFSLTFTIVLPMVLGLWVGTRRQLVENLRERAERLEREQNLKAESAIAAERTRIAREMHDVVAHRVSLMVLHAGGLEVSAEDERTVETAGLIRTTGREALAELREILGVLRDAPGDAAPTAPQPVLSDLAKLVNDSRAAGMAVDWRTTGSPRPLPAQVERTAYRVVQESLTNAAKHAPGADVEVRVDYGARELEAVVVSVPPPERVADEQAPSSGYGLAGLRERLTLVGGTLTAGPLADGAWQVRAIVPVGPAQRVGALRNADGDGESA